MGKNKGKGGSIGFFPPVAEGLENAGLNIQVCVLTFFPSLCPKQRTSFLAKVAD